MKVVMVLSSKIKVAFLDWRSLENWKSRFHVREVRVRPKQWSRRSDQQTHARIALLSRSVKIHSLACRARMEGGGQKIQCVQGDLGKKKTRGVADDQDMTDPMPDPKTDDAASTVAH